MTVVLIFLHSLFVWLSRFCRQRGWRKRQINIVADTDPLPHYLHYRIAHDGDDHSHHGGCLRCFDRHSNCIRPTRLRLVIFSIIIIIIMIKIDSHRLPLEDDLRRSPTRNCWWLARANASPPRAEKGFHIGYLTLQPFIFKWLVFLFEIKDNKQNLSLNGEQIRIESFWSPPLQPGRCPAQRWHHNVPTRIRSSSKNLSPSPPLKRRTTSPPGRSPINVPRDQREKHQSVLLMSTAKLPFNREEGRG